MQNPCPDRKSELLNQYQHVVSRVRAAENRFDRESGSVQLLAVSKTFPASDLAILAAEGVTAFAESYLQEAEEKITALRELSLEWHFIGPIQSNKTQPIARLFDWVHSVDRIKIAQRLNDQRPPELPPLNICLQLNISGESSKSGAGLDELDALLAAITEMPRLRLRGLMAIPARCTDFNEQVRGCAELYGIYSKLCTAGMSLDTLSMGMSGDLEAAISQGSSLVRVGRDIFGERERRQ